MSLFGAEGIIAPGGNAPNFGLSILFIYITIKEYNTGFGKSER
jgi:hypothetical protein